MVDNVTNNSVPEFKVVSTREPEGGEATIAKLIDPVVLAQKEADYKKAKEDLETNFYIVPGGLELAENLLKFVSTEAEWKYTECIGIIEIVSALEKQVKELKSGKKSDLYMKNIELEAAHYFLQRFSSVGLERAKLQNSMLNPVVETLYKCKQDRDALSEMEFALESYREGLTLEQNPNLAGEQV